MNYRVMLNTDTQLFTVVDKNNSNSFANGKTIEEAVSKLKQTAYRSKNIEKIQILKALTSVVLQAFLFANNN